LFFFSRSRVFPPITANLMCKISSELTHAGQLVGLQELRLGALLFPKIAGDGHHADDGPTIRRIPFRRDTSNEARTQ
jgi:hypothetical protein